MLKNVLYIKVNCDWTQCLADYSRLSHSRPGSEDRTEDMNRNEVSTAHLKFLYPTERVKFILSS